MGDIQHLRFLVEERDRLIGAWASDQDDKVWSEAKKLDHDIQKLSQRLALGANHDKDLEYANAERRVRAFRKSFLNSLEPNLRYRTEFAPEFMHWCPMVPTTLQYARLTGGAPRSDLAGNSVLGYKSKWLKENGRTGLRRVAWFPKSKLSAHVREPIDENIRPLSLRPRNVLAGRRMRMGNANLAAWLSRTG